MSAAIVIMESVYSVDEALRIVRLQLGLRLETISRGKSPAKKPIVVPAMARPPSTNAPLKQFL